MAAAAVFSKSGYSKTTMGDIARELGIHTAGLYYYFESREVLVEELLKYITQRLADSAKQTLDSMPDASPLERLKALIRSYTLVVIHRDDVGKAFHKVYDQVSPELRQRTLTVPRAFAALWQSVIDEAIASGDLRDDISPRLLRLLLIGSMSWMPDWYKPNGPNTPEEISDALTTLFLTGALKAS